MIKSYVNHEGVPEISIEEAQKNLSRFKIIDVRRPDEFTGELGHIAGATLSTIEGSFNEDIKSWDKNTPVLMVCRSGARSSRSTAIALQLGFKEVYNMAGGMIAWNGAKFPIER